MKTLIFRILLALTVCSAVISVRADSAETIRQRMASRQGAIDGLKDALARLRKFGGRCVLGFQSIAQVSSTYGTGEAQTIVENCGNTLILRCSGSEHGGTSQFASRLIGEREVIRRHTSRGRDRESWVTARGARRSTSVSEQHVTEVAVLPSELEQLPDLTGYLKAASSQVWVRVRFGHGA